MIEPLTTYHCSRLKRNHQQQGGFCRAGGKKNRPVEVRASHQYEAATLFRIFAERGGKNPKPAVLVEIFKRGHVNPPEVVDWWAYDADCNVILPDSENDITFGTDPRYGGAM